MFLVARFLTLSTLSCYSCKIFILSTLSILFALSMLFEVKVLLEYCPPVSFLDEYFWALCNSYCRKPYYKHRP